MSPLLRPCWLPVVFLTFTGTLAAQAEPAKRTPEQSVAARRVTLQNGDYRSIHYNLSDLSPIEALAYRRLEYLENEAERCSDEQHLNRLRVANATRVELLQAPGLSVYPGGNRRANIGVFGSYGVANPNYGSASMTQNLIDLEGAYIDVLNVERVRQGLPPLVPQMPACVPAGGAPWPCPPPPCPPAPCARRRPWVNFPVPVRPCRTVATSTSIPASPPPAAINVEAATLEATIRKNWATMGIQLRQVEQARNLPLASAAAPRAEEVEHAKSPTTSGAPASSPEPIGRELLVASMAIGFLALFFLFRQSGPRIDY